MALIIDFVVFDPHNGFTSIYVNGKSAAKCRMVNIDGIYRVFDATNIRSTTDIVDSGILQMKQCLEQANIEFRITIYDTTLHFVYQGRKNDNYRYNYVATSADCSVVVGMSIGVGANGIIIYRGGDLSRNEYMAELITTSMANMGISPVYDIASEMTNLSITNESVYDITDELANMSIADPRNFIYIEPRSIGINFIPTSNGSSWGSITFRNIHIRCLFKTEHDSSWTLSSGVITPINSDMMELNVLDFDNMQFLYDNCVFRYNYKWFENGKTYYQININELHIKICLFVSLDDGYIRFYPAY